MIDKEKIEFLIGDDDVPFIRIIDGEYAGISLTLGAVSFPDENEPILSFDYNIIEGSVYNHDKLVKDLGDLVVALIEDRLANGELIYKNGTDDPQHKRSINEN